ncbi:MAG: alanine--glyoxylate aminotransferase family protein, partial [bacterium]
MKFKHRIMAPGPTPVPEESRLEMARTQQYHRTPEFSSVLKFVRDRLRSILNVDWPLALYSASGTGAMEAVV